MWWGERGCGWAVPEGTASGELSSVRVTPHARPLYLLGSAQSMALRPCDAHLQDPLLFLQDNDKESVTTEHQSWEGPLLRPPLPQEEDQQGSPERRGSAGSDSGRRSGAPYAPTEPARLSPGRPDNCIPPALCATPRGLPEEVGVTGELEGRPRPRASATGLSLGGTGDTQTEALWTGSPAPGPSLGLGATGQAPVLSPSLWGQACPRTEFPL